MAVDRLDEVEGRAGVSEITGCPNFRALGGQRRPDGRKVRRGLVFRSEALIEPCEADAAALAAKNIVLVCDLRSDVERERAPNGWWAGHGIERLNLDLLGALAARYSPWEVLRRNPTAQGAQEAM